MQEGVERTEALKEFLPTLQADVKYATFSDEASLRREVLQAVRQELVQGYKRYRLDKAERAQLVASTAAPPLRSIPFQIPRRAAHFQGRKQELAALLEYLRPDATVTLCGPGGIGKTALAAEALARLPADRLDGAEEADNLRAVWTALAAVGC